VLLCPSEPRGGPRICRGRVFPLHNVANAALGQLLAFFPGTMTGETVGHGPCRLQEKLPARLGNRGLAVLRPGVGSGDEVTILLIEHMLHVVPVVRHHTLVESRHGRGTPLEGGNRCIGAVRFEPGPEFCLSLLDLLRSRRIGGQLECLGGQKAQSAAERRCIPCKCSLLDPAEARLLRRQGPLHIASPALGDRLLTAQHRGVGCGRREREQIGTGSPVVALPCRIGGEGPGYCVCHMVCKQHAPQGYHEASQPQAPSVPATAPISSTDARRHNACGAPASYGVGQGNSRHRLLLRA
jgi:hypothetical protein